MHIGDIINNRYKVSEIVGRGALSAVYKAFDMKLCINVAIKETGNSHAPEAMREAEKLNECRHQYIPRIIDIVYSDTSVLIIEDYIEGKDLSKTCENDSLSCKQISRIIMQILSVLEYLHGHNPPIIYSDLKPGNIILSQDNNAYLIDFGAAMYRDNKNVWGTYEYASPEQVLNGLVDEQTDMYSFGKTCFELYRHSGKKINRNIYNILLKCISADKDRRYKSISDVRNSFEELIKRTRRKHYMNIVLVTLSLLIIAVLQQLIEESAVESSIAAEKVYTITGNDPKERAGEYLSDLKENPLDIKKFKSLIYEYKSDFIFSEEEENELKSVIYPNVKRLEQSQIYDEIAYEMGMLYWYYHGDVNNFYNNDNIRKAMYWMSETSYEKADSYRKVGSLILNSQSMIREGNAGDILKDIEYFDDLLKLAEESGNPVITYRCSILILSTISRYGSEIGSPDEAEKVEDIIERIKILNAHADNDHIDLNKLNEVINTTETVVNRYKN